MATEPALRDRVARAVGDGHDAVTTAFVLAAAVGLGTATAWLSADLVGRLPAFTVGALATAGLLYTRPTRRAVAATACYALAALLALVPVAYELPVLIGTDAPVAHLLTTTDLLLFLAFLALAVAPLALGYRIATGPVLPRLRARLTGR
ncbi:hypothetical protein [Halorubellus sp. PRR65]|uniref:hypothetical protein n=1 Tax=Halorubellus sp. PRR65 TaxID=3098148 RepID=UPI002B25A81E|nr:hypothetical protein [Halorubellus sp. PRR65]